MYKLHNDISVLRCCCCGHVFRYKKQYLTNSKYPEDYLIECKNPDCEGWEEVGNNMPGSFDIITPISDNTIC
jgi:hypothetical protein